MSLHEDAANCVQTICELGDVEALRARLQSSSCSENDCIEGLLVAAERGHTALVAFLLEHGYVSPAAVANAAIRRAAAKGHCTAVELLLSDKRVNPAACNSEAFRAAAAAGHKGVVKLLLADPRVNPAADCQAALCSAAKRGDLELLELLLADPRVDPAANACAALSVAAASGYLHVVERLLDDDRVDACADRHKPISAAAAGGHLAIVQLLLPLVDCTGVNAALQSACSAGQVAVMTSVLSHPLADPAADKFAAVRGAADGQHTALLSDLICDPRVDLSRCGQDVLMAACHAGDVALVDRLLTAPNLQSDWVDFVPRPLPELPTSHVAREDNADLYPLVAAAEGGRADVVARLLQDPRVKPDFSDDAPFEAACDNGHVAVVEVLLADPRIDGRAAASKSLVSAAATGNVALLQRLLSLSPFKDSSDAVAAMRAAIRFEHLMSTMLASSRTAGFPAASARRTRRSPLPRKSVCVLRPLTAGKTAGTGLLLPIK